MKVAVLGSGVIGVTTAYYLAKAGHEVTVVDRQEGAALETSFANAGEVSPGYSAPWAAPGLPFKAVKWLFMKNRPLVIWPVLDPAMWVWGLRLLGNCTEARYTLNKNRMLRLAQYSRACLQQLREETGIRYDERTQGTLQLFRTQQQVDGASADMAILERFGVPFELLDREACIRVEPALAQVQHKIAGGLRLPGDETGDCFKFTQGLAQLAGQLGVEFRYGTTIRALQSEGGHVSGVTLEAGTVHADAYVVALGSYSPLLLKPLGISVPVYPVKGYSLTVPIVDPAGAPESTVMDETYKVAVTRLGERIRVGGTAELGGYDLTLRAARRATLDHVVTDLFPRGGDVAAATFWTGLRPMTPDGPPVIGATRFSNLFLNTGHGTLGWTMAAGSGQVLADILSNRRPAIDVSDLTLQRYGGSP
ncbi:MAG: D-amino acid dehydrogenase [Betaproteobacteria bacterium]